MTCNVAIHWPTGDDERYSPLASTTAALLGGIISELHALAIEAEVAIHVSCTITIEPPDAAPAARGADEPTPIYDATDPAADLRSA